MIGWRVVPGDGALLSSLRAACAAVSDGWRNYEQLTVRAAPAPRYTTDIRFDDVAFLHSTAAAPSPLPNMDDIPEMWNSRRCGLSYEQWPILPDA